MNTADLDPKRVVVCLGYKKSQSKRNGCLNPCIYSENNVFTIEIEMRLKVNATLFAKLGFRE